MRFLSLLTFILSAFPYYAYSYCVYNKHSDDTYLEVRQYTFKIAFGGYFYKKIYPGGKECCPYTNGDCNPYTEDPNTTIRIYVRRFNNGNQLDVFSVQFPAGGWVVVDGDKEHHNVAVKWPDGRDYEDVVIDYGAIWIAMPNQTDTASFGVQGHQEENRT